MSRRLYGPPIPGMISPIEATDDMTQDVGIRDGQLFTYGSVTEETLSEAVEAIEAEISAVDTRLTTAEGEIDEAQEDIDSLEARMTTAESAISENEYNITQNATDISSLGTRITTAEGDIDSLETRMSTAEDDIDQCEYDITQNATDISALGSSKQDNLTYIDITISASAWTAGTTYGEAVVSVSGVTSSDIVIPVSKSPLYNYHSIAIASISANSITFNAYSIPTSDIDVRIIIA